MYFKYNDINLYYEEYLSDCSKRNIVILPGFGDTRKTFNNLIYHLSYDYNIYIIDFPGFGKTIFPNYDLTIYDYADMIHEFITELNIDNPVLIGHSFGGRIINVLLGYYKYNYNDVIFIDSAGIKPKKSFIQKIKLYTYKVLKKIFRTGKLRKKIQDIFSSSDYKSIPDNMKKTFQNVVNEDLSIYMKEINSKVLIIWGDKDIITPVSMGKKMNKLINNSEIIIIKNTNHYAYLGREYLIKSIIDKQLEI